ncbi:beta-ketoacyl synthase N-terminal-like domain-containing protein [Nocardia sp. NPDC051900]|uniref:type I polyketide synthase n=1 Tax=Nocardia sp. NPDC051900 TaxID=3364326 RepID=UPI0037AEFD00
MHPTLPALFTAAADACTAEPAIFADGDHRSWEQWRAESAALARALQELGIGKGDLVAVHLPNCWEFLTVHIAVAAIGAVMLPLHTGLGPHELRSMLARTRAGTVVLSAERGHDSVRKILPHTPALKRILVVGNLAQTGGIDDAADGVWSVADLVRRWAGTAPSPERVDPDDPFVLVPSSGTTSLRPKICVHTHRSLMSNAIAVAADARANGDDAIVSASPFTHLFGLLSVHLSVVTRGRQALLAGWDVAEFLRLARSSEATVLFAVPAQIRDVVSRPDLDGIRLREIRASGAAVPATLVANVEATMGARVIVQWGMSEVGAGLFTRPEDPPERAMGTVGRPISGAEVRVVADDGRPCRPGEPGQLQFRSPFRFTEYFEDPQLARDTFTADGWLRTGDLASVDNGGMVTFHGRDAEVINVGGVKFSAVEVETLLDDIPGLDRVAVVGRPDDRLGEYPCLVVTLRPGSVVTLRDATEHLAAKGVADHKVPLELVVLDEMPCTPSGKIARSSLVAMLGGVPLRDEGYSSRGSRAESAWVQELRLLPQARRLQRSLDLVRETVRGLLDAAEPIEPDQVFTDYGLTSATAVRLRAALVEATGLDLPTTIAYDLPTPNSVARDIDERVVVGDTADEPDPTAPVRLRHTDDDPVVVVGMGCRLPGDIGSPDEFWELLVAGRDTIGDFPSDRGWAVDPKAGYARRGGFLDAASFDPAFFGISPREAVAMDPQQRLLLETTWEALEHARIDPMSLRDSETGVFVGVMASDYVPRTYQAVSAGDASAMTGNAAGVASGRISYVLGLHGPAITVDTACSSSLVALHLAVRTLRYGECSLAIVGGATVLSTPVTFAEFARQNGLAADGRCKPFAAAADGTGWGEGVGVLVLERLSDARRAGRRIVGVIRGTAINSDGTSNGLTAPNGLAQQRLIQRALADAGLTPSDVDAVEAHGTGTRLGDPIEANALLATYGRDRAVPLLLGSVKSNIGHTQAAAGVLGTIKTLLAIEHGLVPRTLHVDEPSPYVDWTSDTVRLATDATPWPQHPRPRRAGVSAFGISGTNAHVILEQAPPHDEAAEATPPRSAALVFGKRSAVARPAACSPLVTPLAFSAKTTTALAQQAGRLVSILDGGTAPADVGYSLAGTRAQLEHRAVVFRADHRADLAALAAGTSGYAVTGRADLRGRTVFVFPGHGAQWAGMASALLDSSPVFAASMAECESALGEFVDWSVSAAAADESALRRPEVVQPVLFAVTVSLARLWQEYGVVPDAVVGHSFGEIAAAHVAGVLSLRDAARVIVCRAALCADLDGRMLSVESPAAEVSQRIRGIDDVSIAGYNSPRTTVLSGDADSITALMTQYRDARVPAHLVRIGFASHSAHVEPIRERLLVDLSGLTPKPAQINWYSTVTGKPMDGPEADASYWYDNLRQPVQFAATVEALAAAGSSYFVEAGPHPALTAAIAATVSDAALPIGTIRRSQGGFDQFTGSLARGYVRGLPVDWTKFFDGAGARQIDLPTYPFEHRRYWHDRAVQLAVAGQLDESRPQWADIASADETALVAASTAFREHFARLGTAEQAQLVEDLVVTRAAGLLGYHNPNAVAADHSFLDIGLDSLTAIALHDNLSKVTGVELPPLTELETDTPAVLAQRLLHELLAPPDTQR